MEEMAVPAFPVCLPDPRRSRPAPEGLQPLLLRSDPRVRGDPCCVLLPLQTLGLHSCPKPVVFVLHTFLSAKVTRMGLLV